MGVEINLNINNWYSTKGEKMEIQSEFSKKYIVDMEEKLPLIIDAFCSLYGEEYRPVIERNLEGVSFSYSGSNNQLYNIASHSESKLDKQSLEELEKLRVLYNGQNKLLLWEDVNDFISSEIRDIPPNRYLDIYNFADAPFEHTLGACILIFSSDMSKLYKVLHYKMDCLNDRVLVHELVHAISTTITENNPKGNLSVGVHTYVDDGSGRLTVSVVSYREYMLSNIFTEVITEYVTQEICNQLKTSGVTLINSDISEYRSQYNKSLCILKPLFDAIKPTLIDAFMNNDIKKLENLLGENDLKALVEMNYSIFTSSHISDLFDIYGLERYTAFVQDIDKLEWKPFGVDLIMDAKKLVEDLVQKQERKQ